MQITQPTFRGTSVLSSSKDLPEILNSTKCRTIVNCKKNVPYLTGLQNRREHYPVLLEEFQRASRVIGLDSGTILE